MALRLGGKGSPFENLIEHNLVERKLILRPKASLVPNTEYQIDVSTSIKSLAGLPSTKQPGDVSDWDSGAANDDGAAACARGHHRRQRSAEAVMYSDGCHSAQSPGEIAARGLDLSQATPTLRSYLTSANASGSPEALRLVQPGQPERSYLLRKLLAGVRLRASSAIPCQVKEARCWKRRHCSRCKAGFGKGANQETDRCDFGWSSHGCLCRTLRRRTGQMAHGPQRRTNGLTKAATIRTEHAGDGHRTRAGRCCADPDATRVQHGRLKLSNLAYVEKLLLPIKHAAQKGKRALCRLLQKSLSFAKWRRETRM